MKVLIVAAALALVAGAVSAQQPQWTTQNRGYTIQRPGELPTFVNPNYGGGYTMQTPGQPPAFVNPTFGGGGYIVQTPGRPPTFINPQ